MAEIGEVHVSFRLVADHLDPSEVTEQLHLQPTIAYAKGELSPPGRVTGRSHRRLTGMWRLESPLARQAPLNEHLCALLDELDPVASAITRFGQHGFAADFYCGVFLTGENQMAALPPTALARMATLGATLVLDVYTYFPEDESVSPASIQKPKNLTS